MTDQPEKLDLRSHTLPDDKATELLRLFPEIRTEDGHIDFDRLKLVLGETVDVGKERYGLTWPGKADCFKTIQAPSEGTLLPCPQESVDFDTTENLIIEGDNLEVLKLLQKAYQGRVKMIYIDPPYNTGNDFIYPDNYTESLRTYLEYTGQVDAQGKKFGTNTDTEGRFHSRWLNLMYPRLSLARNLLRDDGVIFISIDDNEAANLLKVCDEIFGEENFVANIVWQKKYSVSNDDPGIAPMHDFIVVYQKTDNFERNLLPRTEKQLERYKNPDNDPRGDWASGEYVSGKTRWQRPTLWYPIKRPKTGKDVWPEENAVWRYSREKHKQMEQENRLYWGPDYTYEVPRIKRFLSELKDGIVPSTWWTFNDAGHNDEGQKETAELLGKKVFGTPKPVRLMKRILAIGAGNNDIVLDFFAGSGALGQAVLEQNQEEGTNRKFILVQLPEPTDNPSFPTIATITAERIRRVINKLNTAEAGQLPMAAPQDRGFRVFKLAQSGFKPWDAALPADPGALQQRLDLHVDNLLPGRTELDLLTEILLKSGFPLTTPVETLTLAGKTIYRVAGGALLVCLDRELDLELIRALAAQTPERVVLLDAGFNGQDSLKTNAVHIFKDAGVESFRTV